MSLSTIGYILVIKDTQKVSANFTKREIVVEITDNPKYPQTVLFELSGDRVNLADDYRVGDRVEVEFNLRGREWKSPAGEVKYFNTLSVWKLRGMGERQSGGGGGGSTSSRNDEPRPGDMDDIPF